MKVLVLIICIALVTANGYAQSQVWPGGVPGAILWNAMDTSADLPGLRSLLPGNTSNFGFGAGNNTIGYLNFRPGLMFSAGRPIQIDLGNQALAASSIFTVYLCTDTGRENSIWYMTDNDTTQLVLTTDRMADFSSYKYMNYTDLVRAHPKVNIYVQQTSVDTTRTIDDQWYIGSKPASPNLPVYPFKGLIPEIVAYNRALSGQERLQVSSYLALKYGVTQTEPYATYLNSAGEVIWDGLQYPGYHNNIAGLGRDDSCGLLQMIACSGNTPGLLTLSTTQSISDRNSLLWGDNAQTLTPDQRTAGLPPMLKKKWLMIAHGSQPDTTGVQLDTRQIDAPLPIDPVFWLAIDHTGKGNFSLPGTTFTRMSQLDPQGQAYFQNIVWNATGSGKDLCALIPAQNLLLAATIDSPNCATNATGSLNIRILGGDPPYQLTVLNNNTGLLQRQIADNNQSISVTNLPSGKYWLRVTDSTQQSYVDSFYINSSDAPVVQALAPAYTLPPGGLLTIDAADQMPPGLSYQWTGPDNFLVVDPQVIITKPGIYTLACSNAGCTSRQDISVSSPAVNPLDNVLLYPNPSAGNYNVRVTLPNPAPITMLVYTVDGRLVGAVQSAGRSNYLFSSYLESPGQYEVYLTSGSSVTAKQLLILK